MERVRIGNRECLVLAKGIPEKAVYLGENHMEDIEDLLKDVTDLVLIMYDVEDWNRDFSPWPYHMNRNFDFAGEGMKTLNWLKENCYQYVVTNYPDVQGHIVCGYSLAGLFSLWCYYECPLFTSAGSMSGSLWFDGWHEYITDRTRKGTVYLSLGDRERKARNPVMARVQDETEYQYSIAAANGRAVFVLNEGNHFMNVPKRITDGIKWLLANDID